MPDLCSTPVPAPRHARVVPWSLVRLLSPATRLGRLQLRPADLLYWPMAEDLTASDRRLLYGAVKRRLKDADGGISGVKSGVQLVQGWESCLAPQDVAVLRRCEADVLENLASHTFGELARAAGVLVADVVALLARVEALSWEPAPAVWRSLQETRRRARGFDGEPQEVRQAPLSQGELAQALSISWLARVPRLDPRMGWPEDGLAAEDLGQWLRRVQAQGLERAPEATAPIVRAILLADRLDCASEVEQLAKLAIARSWQRLTGERQQQFLRAFGLRYLVPVGPARSYEEVGRVLGVTRQRVGHLLGRMLEAVRGELATPALWKLLDRLPPEGGRALVDLQAAAAEDGLLGAGAGLEALLQLARDLQLETVVKVAPRPSPASRLSDSQMDGPRREPYLVAHAAGEPDPVWGGPALRAVEKEIRAVGACSLVGLAGGLVMGGLPVPGRESLLSCVQGMPGFRWLDRNGGWFTVMDAGERSALALEVRKVLGVAGGPVHLDQLVIAVARGFRETSLPPMAVIKSLFEQWAWVHELPRTNRFSVVTEGDWGAALSEIELATLGVAERHNGVFSRMDLTLGLEVELGVSRKAVDDLVTTSPIVVPVEQGIYQLAGRKLKIEALVAARGRAEEVRRQPKGQAAYGVPA